MKTFIPLGLIILLIVAGVGYIFFSSSDSNKTDSTNQIQIRTQQTVTPQTNASTDPKAVQTARGYASFQFGVQEDQVKIVRSEKQQWQDTCLDIPNSDGGCTKQQVTGYEVIVEVNGNQVTYRASDDGTIIFVVKTPSFQESAPDAFISPTE